MGKEIMVSIVCVGFFAAIVLSIYFVMKFRSITPPPVFDGSADAKKKADWQKPGIVVLGIGLGLLIVGLLPASQYGDSDAVNVGIVAVCTGVAMIVANVLDKDKSTED